MGLSKPPQAHVPALHGENITSATRGPAFGKWVTSYFIHGDLSTRDPDQLNFRHPDPSRKDTYADMLLDELRNIVDFSASARCDTILSDPAFTSVLSAVVEKALFDSRIRAACKGTEVACLYTQENPGTVHFAVWDLERRAEAAEGNAPITFRPAIEGANHFVHLVRIVFYADLTRKNLGYVGGSKPDARRAHCLHEGLTPSLKSLFVDHRCTHVPLRNIRCMIMRRHFKLTIYNGAGSQ
jgi:hypothetical protein